MAKYSVEQIKQDEKKVLEKLTKNAHMGINEIADKIGFSRQRAQKIIKNLEKNNTIWGYTVIIDDNKMGRKRFNILLKKAPVKLTDEKLNIVINGEIKKIAAKNGVNLESTYFFNGSYDGQMCVTAESIIQVKNFIADMEKKIGATYFKEIKILEILVPIQMRGFYNPNLKQLRDYFVLD